MKTFISLSALFLSLSLTAQTNPATWYLNDASGNGIQSPSSTASGSYSTAMGQLSEASGNYSTAMGIRTIASGYASTAMGYETTASGPYSTAMGRGTTASGIYSTAMGYETTASGGFSIAMGYYSTASGTASTAMGGYTTASDYASVAIGQYNNSLSSVTTNGSATAYDTDNTALVIGNGVDGDNRSDALVVKFNGDATLAGSMTATSFIGDGSQLTNLPSNGADSPFSYNSNEAGGIEVADYTTASGSRAFAVGNDNLASGSSSTAIGRGTIASGDDSTALGANTEASGENSTAMGEGTTASNYRSTAMGYATTASGINSTAMGRSTTASGTASTSMGEFTTAGGDSSTALGYETTASGRRSTAMGQNTIASGYASTAMGNATIASGDYSTAIGAVTTAEDFLTVALGVHNKSGETPNPQGFSYQNTAFVIGNGGFANDGSYIGTPESYSNAFEVLFDGTTTIAGDLNVNSDARLKANIVSIGSTLSKLLQIDGKSYTMKKDESEKQKIGLLAQDIEKVFPELVSESHGVKSVNYQGLVPVLINALKEQQREIDELKTMLKAIIEKT